MYIAYTQDVRGYKSSKFEKQRIFIASLVTMFVILIHIFSEVVIVFAYL